jgi:hypothetical protein
MLEGSGAKNISFMVSKIRPPMVQIYSQTIASENEVKLKPGTEVDITIEADVSATEPRETSKTGLPEKTKDKKR